MFPVDDARAFNGRHVADGRVGRNEVVHSTLALQPKCNRELDRIESTKPPVEGMSFQQNVGIRERSLVDDEHLVSQLEDVLLELA
jgi:hypothetical protein